LFSPLLVTLRQAFEVNFRVAGRHAAIPVCLALLGLLGNPRAAWAAETRCTEAVARPASAAALQPSDVLLMISSPRAGETVVESSTDESIALTVDYWGPRLLIGTAAHAVDDYHLAYLLDEAATPYIGTLTPIPRCDPHVVHSAATRVTFDHVPHGSHVVVVLLVGSNDVSVNPPVAAMVTFMVR
jgi:hypothetical protein